jgi:hypothetical protein
MAPAIKSRRTETSVDRSSASVRDPGLASALVGGRREDVEVIPKLTGPSRGRQMKVVLSATVSLKSQQPAHLERRTSDPGAGAAWSRNTGGRDHPTGRRLR